MPSAEQSINPLSQRGLAKNHTSQLGLGATAGCALSQVTPSGARGQLKGHRPRHTATRTAPAPQATRTGHTALPVPHSRDTFRDKRRFRGINVHSTRIQTKRSSRWWEAGHAASAGFSCRACPRAAPSLGATHKGSWEPWSSAPGWAVRRLHKPLLLAGALNH